LCSAPPHCSNTVAQTSSVGVGVGIYSIEVVVGVISSSSIIPHQSSFSIPHFPLSSVEKTGVSGLQHGNPWD